MTVAATDAGGIQEIIECSEITVYSMQIEDYQKQAEKAQRPNEMKNESNKRTNERTAVRCFRALNFVSYYCTLCFYRSPIIIPNATHSCTAPNSDRRCDTVRYSSSVYLKVWFGYNRRY